MKKQLDTITKLMAISPIDGRYGEATFDLRYIFSEYALQKERVFVEIKWLIFLGKVLKLFPINDKIESALNNIRYCFEVEDAVKLKKMEEKTNHDVKVVEYYIKDMIKELGLDINQELVHLFLTSEDITNAAIGLMLNNGRNIILKKLDSLHLELRRLSNNWKMIPMMAHTHGQPATPTTVGKEFNIFNSRLLRHSEEAQRIEIEVKFNGASGNFNAHKIALPDVDWIQASKYFVSNYLELKPLISTTQINHYAYAAEMFDSIKRMASVVIDFDRDMWMYISKEYLVQIPKEGEVGSSTMPHKVNPIDFENSEGNMEIAEVLLDFFSKKLQKSRLQRDLTDSTTLRNLGTAFGHILIGLSSALRGLKKIDINKRKLNQDLNNNWALLTEAIQVVMRLHGEEEPYERLKAISRGKKITKLDIWKLLDTLEKVPEEDILRLKSLTPRDYIGLAPILASYKDL